MGEFEIHNKDKLKYFITECGVPVFGDNKNTVYMCNSDRVVKATDEIVGWHICHYLKNPIANISEMNSYKFRIEIEMENNPSLNWMELDEFLNSKDESEIQDFINEILKVYDRSLLGRENTDCK